MTPSQPRKPASLQPAATPTIRDVAALAGVSITTVSRVLNGRQDVAEETAQRVQNAIDALHFETNFAARSMRSRRKQVIGLIVPDMNNTYGVEIVKAAGHAIAATEYDLIAMTTGTTDLHQRDAWQQQQITRVNGTVTDGVVVVVPGRAEYRTVYPLVVVDPYLGSDAHPAVRSDNFGGALEAMRYLIGLGHRRIGHIIGYDFIEATGERLRAYQCALSEADIPFDERLVQKGAFDFKSGVAAMRDFASMANPPSAIFAGNDDSALGVMVEARALGYSIPDDLSLVGFDNVSAAATSHPGLTTVDQGLYEMIRVAFAMLIDLASGRTPAERTVTVVTRLIVRESCAAPTPRE